MSCSPAGDTSLLGGAVDGGVAAGGGEQIEEADGGVGSVQLLTRAALW